jgi:2,3-bisphosphoglycerate-dependent phosphoglycerate mutase
LVHRGWPGHDAKYASLGIREGELPTTESLQDTLVRALPSWEGQIVGALRAGQNVLLVTHGNVVRLVLCVCGLGRGGV